MFWDKGFCFEKVVLIENDIKSPKKTDNVLSGAKSSNFEGLLHENCLNIGFKLWNEIQLFLWFINSREIPQCGIVAPNGKGKQ